MRLHSVLKEPMIVSIKALLNASPTLPIYGPMPANARCSVNRIETSDALRVSSREGLWLVERCGFGIEDACAEAVVEAADESVEEVALRRSMPVSCSAAPVVVSVGSGRGSDGGEKAQRYPVEARRWFLMRRWLTARDFPLAQGQSGN